MSLSKKLSITASAAVLAFTSMLPAQAATTPYPHTSYLDSMTGWYFGVHGAITIIPKVSVAIPTVTVPDFGTFSSIDLRYIRPNWAAGGQVGYKKGSFRYEGEFIYMDGGYEDIGALSTAVPGADGGSDIYTGMFNVMYHFDPLHLREGSPLDMYAGIGIGYAHIKNNIIAPSVPRVKQQDDEFAYQGILGIMYNVDDTGALFIDYRYYATTPLKFTGSRFQNHTINVGINFALDV